MLLEKSVCSLVSAVIERFFVFLMMYMYTLGNHLASFPGLSGISVLSSVHLNSK